MLFALCLGSIFLQSSSRPLSDGALSLRFDQSAVSLKLFRARNQERYSIQLPGQPAPVIKPLQTTLKLRFANFDPLVGKLAVPADLASDSGNEWFIVQFRAQVLQDFYRGIEACGGQVFTYLPDNALICRFTPTALEKCRRLAYVRWIDAYEPAYRIDPAILDEALSPGQQERAYNIQVSDWSGAAKNLLAEKIRLMGGTPWPTSPNGSFMTATLTPFQLRQILHENETFYVDAYSQPQQDMDIVRQVGGANLIEAAPGNYVGQGIVGEVMDGACQTAHQSLQHDAFVVRSNPGTAAHGTACTGIVFGNGAGNIQGRGLLPGAKGIFGSYSSLTIGGGSTSRYDWLADLVSPTYHGMFESNSWGTSPSPNYETNSAELDQATFNLDILIFHSQGNTMLQEIRPEANAKNVMAIGGINHFNTATKSDDAWLSASYGPTADGRLKPDMSGWYDLVFCPTNTSNTAYANFGGTSAATPICAGYAGLFMQMYTDGLFGQSMLGGDRFANKPHFETSKAFVVNQASQYPFSGSDANLSRYKQGWGLFDVNTMYANRNKFFVVDRTDVLTNLATKNYRLYVGSGTPEFHATMAYRDPPGTLSASVWHINDLQLKVTAPNGTIYYGNKGLTVGNYSTSGGTPGGLDTVYNVIIANPAVGVWQVEVKANAINMDGHPETTGVLDADYGLVVAGVSMTSLVNSQTVTYGSVRSGTLADMETSNNRRQVLQPPVEFNDVLYSTLIEEVKGTAPMASPNQFSFRLESQSNFNDTLQFIQFFDYTTNAWVLASQTGLSSNDSVVEINAPGPVSHFINAGTGEVKARLYWARLAQDDVDWTVSVDQARWFFQP